MKKLTVLLIALMALAGCTKSNSTAAPPEPVVINVKASVTYPGIVKLTNDACSYNRDTHAVTAAGVVSWVPPTGGGALGTVSVDWTGKHKYTASAVTPQFFDGSWSLAGTATTNISHCNISGQFVAPTAESVLTYLQAHSLPVTGVIAYDAATDPNNLLGRPSGYLSKVAWQDTRVDQTFYSAAPGGVQFGGSIEVFSNSTKALARANYIGAIGQASPALGSEYDYLKGPILLRVSAKLTPAEAAEYMQAIPGATEFQYSGTAGAPPSTTAAP